MLAPLVDLTLADRLPHIRLLFLDDVDGDTSVSVCRSGGDDDCLPHAGSRGNVQDVH